MLFSAMGSLGDRLDTKFLTAYALPAFIAMLGSLWIIEASSTDQRLSEAVMTLNSVQQAILVLLLLLATTMLAFLMQTLSRPIVSLVAGRTMPKALRQRAIRRQRRSRERRRPEVGMIATGTELLPHDPEATAPTRFGNVVAAADDYPRLMYSMQTLYWWPRLLPLLPVEFQDQLRTVETPMRAMLNLGMVAFTLGAVAAAALALAGSQFVAAVMALAVGCILAELFYRAAVAQAADLVRAIWVAFDLYRAEILKQFGEEPPSDLDTERALWMALAERLRVLEQAPGAPVGETREAASRCAPRDAAPGPVRPAAAPRG